MSYCDRDDDLADTADAAPGALLKDIGVALTALALCLVLASNLFDLARGKDQLSALVARQQTTLKGAGKAEAQVDSLARGLQQLADGGNPNAQKIVAVLHANGVNIKP